MTKRELLLFGIIRVLLEERRDVTEATVSAWNTLRSMELADYCDVHNTYFWMGDSCPNCDMKRDWRKKK